MSKIPNQTLGNRIWWDNARLQAQKTLRQTFILSLSLSLSLLFENSTPPQVTLLNAILIKYHYKLVNYQLWAPVWNTSSEYLENHKKMVKIDKLKDNAEKTSAYQYPG